jgi:cellulose biosynthesis protein BcsQ
MVKPRVTTGSPKGELPPRLMVDAEAQSPKPLDRRIASVSLRTTTNNPTEGYDLILSASFGRERVILSAEGFEIDVAFSLNTADVELLFAGCAHSLLDNDKLKHAESWKSAITEHTTTALQKRTAASIRGGAAAVESAIAVKGQIGGQHSSDKTTISTISTQNQIAQDDWYLMGSDAIRIGRTGKMLDGPIIADFKGWRVTPRNDGSTVLARVRVRENWINFDDVQYIKTPRPVQHLLRTFFGPTSERKKRERLFSILLRHLAKTELQEHQHEREATIAVATLVVKPGGEYATALPTGKRRTEIAIPRKPIEKLLSSESGHEAGTLIALGVQRELIPWDPHRAGKAGKRAFVPASSPTAAANLFNQIHANPGAPIRKAGHLPNALRDLRALGLIVLRKRRIALKVDLDVSADVILRRYLSQTPSIEVARTVLRIKPDASGIDIADAVALELGMNWSKRTTKQRSGGAIKKWAAWLEPHLTDQADIEETVDKTRVPQTLARTEYKNGRAFGSVMNVWSIVNPKGGSGKTTLALHLAVAAAMDHKVLVIDLDPQQTADRWHIVRARTRGSKDDPSIASGPYQKLADMLRTARKFGAELVLIDTAPRFDKAILTSLRAATMVLVPLKSSLFDRHALEDCAQLINLARARSKAVVILNAVPPNRKRELAIRESLRYSNHFGLEVAPERLSELPAFSDAASKGCGVTEIAKNSTAAKEIIALYRALWKRSNKDKED